MAVIASIVPRIEDMKLSSCSTETRGLYAPIVGAIVGGGTFAFGFVLTELSFPFFAKVRIEGKKGRDII
jgi:hypothetical protein